MKATTLLMLLLCACGGQYTHTTNSDSAAITDGGNTSDTLNKAMQIDLRLPEPDILTTLDTQLHDLYCTPLISGESIAAYNYPPEASFKYLNGCDASYAHVIYFGGNKIINHSVFPNGLTCGSTGCTKVTNPNLIIQISGMPLTGTSEQLAVTGNEQLSVGAQVFLTTSIGRYVGKGGHAMIQYNNIAPGEVITIKLIHTVMCLDGGNKCGVVIDYSMKGVFTKLQ